MDYRLAFSIWTGVLSSGWEQDRSPGSFRLGHGLLTATLGNSCWFGMQSQGEDMFNNPFRINLSLFQLKMVDNKRKVCRTARATLFHLFADMCSPIWKKATCQYEAGIPRHLWKVLRPESESEDWGWHGWRRLEFLRWAIERPWKIWFLPARSSSYFY